MKLRGLVLLAAVAGCDGSDACEEDVRAQVLEQRIEIEVGGQSLSAEVADEPLERDRGWKHRVCDKEALVLVPDAPGEPVGIWGCGLVDPIDVAFVADGEVVEVVRGFEPCAEPCGGCPIVGDDIGVDLVLEVPRGAVDLQLGQPVTPPSLP